MSSRSGEIFQNQSGQAENLLTQWYQSLSPRALQEFLEENRPAENHATIYGFMRHYDGEQTLEQFNLITAIVSGEESCRKEGDYRENILRLLTEKWQDFFPSQPQQVEVLADALLRNGWHLWPIISAGKLPFASRQLSQIIVRKNNDKSFLAMFAKTHGENFLPEHCAAIIEPMAENKQKLLRKTNEAIDRGYTLMLGDWEMMRTSYSKDPKPQPLTQAERIEAEELACRDLYETCLKVIEKCPADALLPQVDMMMDVADRSGRILRAIVTHLGDQLSEPQRRKTESQFGDLALLKHMLEEDLPLSEWIGELWGEVTAGSGLNDARAFATLFSKKSMEHYPLRYVDQLVQSFLVDTSVDDWQRQFISCGLLAQPERLSEENFYTAFAVAHSLGSGWFERHADFFTPETSQPVC